MALPLLSALLLFFHLAQNTMRSVGECMRKEKLVEKIRELLKTDADLNFLLIVKKEELDRVVACSRDRVDQADSSFI